MQLRLKIFLLSIVPMAVAVGLVILTVQSQTLKLAKQERDLVESSYLASKEAELRAYVRLAKSYTKKQGLHAVFFGERELSGHAPRVLGKTALFRDVLR